MRTRRPVVSFGLFQSLAVIGALALTTIATISVAGWWIGQRGTEQLIPALGIAGLIVFVIGAGAVCWLYLRARPAWAVASALHDYGAGERDASALEICGEWGVEASAWNMLLDDLRGSGSGHYTEITSEIGQGALESADAGIGDALWLGLMIVDPDMHVRYCNGSAAALLSKRREDCEGRPITSVIDDERVKTCIETALRGEVRARQTVEINVSEEGHREVLRVGVRSLTDRMPGAVVVVEDVTQHRAADEARNAFVAQASHELRSPLTNMRLYVESLTDDTCDEKDRAKAINVLTSELRRLERIVTDMLSVAEIESGSIEIRRDDVKIDELMQSLGQDFEQLAREKNIALELRIPPKVPTIQADRDKIALTLHNIVNNALKYTPENGRVTVEAEERSGQLRIDVHDTGIGIAEQEVPHIFERFYRAKDERLSEITGSGLGLSIAREIVRRHGGDISAESSVNEGSTFTVSLPVVVDRAA